MPSPLGNPPGPIGWPLLGMLPQFRANPAEFLLRTSQEYGDIVYFRLGLQKVFFLNRPDLIEEVLVSIQGNFTKSRMLQRAKTLLGEGLLTSEGPLHLRQRRLVQPAFSRERLASYAQTMVSCADRAQGRWTDGESLDVAGEMMRLTLAVVGLTLFSRDTEGDAADIGSAMTALLATYGTLLLPFGNLIRMLPAGPVRRAKSAQKLLDAKVYEIIRERRAEGSDRGDLLSMLLLASESNGDSMDDRQVRDEAMTLILAGHETTATALTWTWYLLSQHPEVETRLHAEWQDVLGGRLPEFADLPNLVYTDRVIAESLRLYPPAWALGRMAIREFRLYNHIIPARAICLMSPYAMHRNPRFWPAPQRFDPDRFAPENRASRPKFAYFPFGGGARVCIGERFAQMEAVLLLASIGQRWRFRLEPGQRVDIHPQITLRPRYGMRMTGGRVVA